MLKNILKYIRPFVLLISLVSLVSCGFLGNRSPSPILTPPPFDPNPTLYSVYMLSASEGWAVGGTFVVNTRINDKAVHVNPKNGTILHYSGGKWTDKLVSEPLFSVSVDSTKDGWAV